MSNLIVDFPQRCKSSGKAKRKRVQFANKVEITFFHRHDTDIITSEILWYGRQDYKNMRANNRQAVLDVHRRMRKSPEDASLKECTLNGIEQLLTPNIIRKSQERISKRLAAVLMEQERHDYLGSSVHDSWEAIGHKSIQYSKRAVKRARKIGLLQESCK